MSGVSHLDEDWRKTEAILNYCKSEYHGFTLVTGHTLSVDKTGSAWNQKAGSGKVGYVALCISQPGKETGYFKGRIPVLLAKCENGEYELWHGVQKDHCEDFDQFREALIQFLAEIDDDYLALLFQRIRQRKP